jgi:hypothetical protein
VKLLGFVLIVSGVILALITIRRWVGSYSEQAFEVNWAHPALALAAAALFVVGIALLNRANPGRWR